MKRYYGYTIIGWINLLLAQWLFFRITRRKRRNKNQFGLMYPAVPLTGWHTDFLPGKQKTKWL